MWMSNCSPVRGAKDRATPDKLSGVVVYVCRGKQPVHSICCKLQESTSNQIGACPTHLTRPARAPPDLRDGRGQMGTAGGGTLVDIRYTWAPCY